MTGTKSVPTITSLTTEYPYPIKNLQLIGMRLKRDVTVEITIDRAENLKEISVGLLFEDNERAQSVTFEDEVTLAKIPPVLISTAVLAEAVHDPAIGFNMAELSEQIFAAALSETALVTLELDDTKNDEADEGWIDISITAGEFAVSHVVPFAHFSFALTKEQTNDGASENKADDAGGN